MNSATSLGLVFTGIGIVGYAVGIPIAYPGRAFSITSIMIGITLLAIRDVFDERISEP